MKRKIGLLAAMFLICAFCIAIAEPTAAAKTKMVDKESIKGLTLILAIINFHG